MTLENIYTILLGLGIALAVFAFALIKRRFDRPEPEPEPIPVRVEPQRLDKPSSFGRPMGSAPIPRPRLVSPPARREPERSKGDDYEVISPYDPRSPLFHTMMATDNSPSQSTSDQCSPSSSYDSGSSSSYDSGSSCDSGSSSSGGTD